MEHIRSQQENAYTSTGIKFWRHKDSMISYRKKTGNTVISTHISPEGACNLKCEYCCVSKRKYNNRIDIEVIKNYVSKLKTRGLKAVIITGGGEPTLYPSFVELVEWLHKEQGLQLGIITNGTNINRFDNQFWNMFTWIRISLNFFQDYQKLINFPKIDGTVGASMVYTNQTLTDMMEISHFVDKDKVEYIRVLPNIMHSQDILECEHRYIEKLLKEINDERFFCHVKQHAVPKCEKCHQAYFRPYLSEVDGGTVFPCDSLVFNEEQMKFGNQYAICKPEEILDFMDYKIDLRFDAREICHECVFTDNINLLDAWVNTGMGRFDKYNDPLIHENFV